MVCPFCRARMDVSTIAPFNKAVCPSCGNEVTVPARLGDFLLTELLGMGGMGGVYRAHDETLGRDVAIKVMLKSLGDNPEFVTTFRREAQAAAKLNHPNIAQIYSFGQEKGQPYIVMELVPGAHFDEMISGPEPLDVPTIMKIGADIASGLQMAADNNLIHGDIKPENILMDERNTAKLLDFGIAAKPSKGENEIWGTPYYIAPERVRRQRVDFRSDIYCLGGTLYHAVTQRPPFEGADAIEVVRARLLGPPEPPEKYRPDLDPEVSAIIMRMLQAEPAMRYPNYSSLLSDMRKYLARVQPKAPATSSRRFVIKGNKAAAAAAAERATGGTAAGRHRAGHGTCHRPDLAHTPHGRHTRHVSRCQRGTGHVGLHGLGHQAGRRRREEECSDCSAHPCRPWRCRRSGLAPPSAQAEDGGRAPRGRAQGGFALAGRCHRAARQHHEGRDARGRYRGRAWPSSPRPWLVEQELGDAYTARILEEPPGAGTLPCSTTPSTRRSLRRVVPTRSPPMWSRRPRAVRLRRQTKSPWPRPPGGGRTTEEAAAEEAAAENDAVAAEMRGRGG